VPGIAVRAHVGLYDVALLLSVWRRHGRIACSLQQNFPNPFNPETIIQYELPENSYVTIIIYNILGQLVKDFKLSFEDITVGNHSVTWDGTNYKGIPVASGVYFYTIQQGHYAATEKMLLLR